MAEPVMAFTMDVVSRLTGLSEWQLRRLDVDGIYSPSLAQANRRRPYSRIYTFADLVSLRVISKLRKLGIPRQDIRRAANLLKELPGATWEGTQFFVADGKLYLSHDEMVVATRPYGQHAMPAVLDLSEIGGDMRRQVDRLRVRGKTQVGEVVRDRYISGGKPVFAGTRIPVSSIQSLLRAGMSDETILYEYPRLKPGDLDRARQESAGEVVLHATG